VAWRKVCRPLQLGGLGISGLKELCWALRMRWLWLSRTEPSRPWIGLPMKIPKKATSFFNEVVLTVVGDGASTKFWKDKWLHGKKIADLAPRLLATIPKRIVNNRTVIEALTNRKWIADIKGALSVGVLIDYLQLWEMLSAIELQPGVEDRHIFSIAPDGMYSAKSAYNGLFMGSVSFGHFTRVWKTWAPPKCRFFIWLAAHNKCWTTDRLAKKGLNHHEKCLLYDQADETLDHLLVACSLSRVFWYPLFRKFGLHSLAPQPTVTSFLNWWEEVSEVVSGVTRKGLNSLIILGAWTIWIHRNKCVFDGLSPCLTYILAWADEERSRWEAAGAKALCSLAASAAAP
jgi:hypothetical protein